MANPLLVGIPTNRPDRLRTCLLNVLNGLQEENIKAEVFVCDGSGKAEDNQAFADVAAQPHGVSVTIQDEKAFQQSQAEPFRILFDGPYGGPRNAILRHAVRKSKDVIFLDDDVVPTEAFFTRFATHLQQHAIVVGAYAGKRTGATFLMDKATRALTDYLESNANAQDARRRAREAFSGDSDDWPPSVEGYRGGCMAVSLYAAAAYGFFPTHFRMEDGLYCSLARHFVDQDAFKPFLPEAPVGFHKPHPGSIRTLVDYYLNAVQGACVGKSIEYALTHFGKNPTPKQIAQSCESGPKGLLDEFSPEKTRLRREQQKPLDDAVRALGDAELQAEYDRFVHIGPDDVILPDLENYVQGFFQVQKTWERINL